MIALLLRYGTTPETRSIFALIALLWWMWVAYTLGGWLYLSTRGKNRR